MKQVGLLSLLVLMALGSSLSHAKSIQQEIDDESRIAMKATGTKAYTRGSLVHLVPIGGMNFSNFKGATGNYTFSTTSGYEAGVGVLIGRGDLQFETGLMYAERGSKESYKFNFESWDITYQNKYLEIPAMARYNVVNNSDIRIYAKGGIVMGVLQSSKGTLANVQNPNMAMNGAYSNMYGVNTYNSSLVNDNNTRSAFASTDLRWALGIGGQVRMTRSLAWTLEGDYQNSTSEISTSQPNGYNSSTGFNLTMETYGFRTGLVWSI
ncbi:MAG: hypothetical protein EOP04_16470 [Proteobacteria bacterium]|nr:MAG: hypothetical protein EOP04_16470 [Pseudomonadota bacterium]